MTNERVISKQEQGRKNRRDGKSFELLVRKDLENKGFCVFRNSNDVVDGVFRQAKSKWNPFTKMPMTLQSGFPDYLVIKRQACGNCVAHGFEDCGWMAQFIECKKGKYLDKDEKEKVQWIISKLHIPVCVAHSKDKKIIYEDIPYDPGETQKTERRKTT
jgi:hypothetical protein